MGPSTSRRNRSSDPLTASCHSSSSAASFAEIEHDEPPTRRLPQRKGSSRQSPSKSTSSQDKLDSMGNSNSRRALPRRAKSSDAMADMAMSISEHNVRTAPRRVRSSDSSCTSSGLSTMAHAANPTIKVSSPSATSLSSWRQISNTIKVPETSRQWLYILIGFAIAFSIINDMKVAVCVCGTTTKSTLRQNGSARDNGIQVNTGDTFDVTQTFSHSDGFMEFYTEDEAFVPGNGITKFRFPTQTFSLNNIPHDRDDGSLVVGVLSTAHRPHDRTKIRKSWASGYSNVFFLVSGNWTGQLEDEFREHKDMIYIDSPENYRMITAKVMVFFTAVNKYLPNAVILKTDDDSYVRMPEMERIVRLHHAEQLYRGRGCRPDAEVVRNRSSPWYVSRKVYPEKYYPPYAYGGGYLLSASLNRCVVKQMKMRTNETEVFPIEDTYVAILLQNCPRVKCKSDHRFETFSHHPIPPKYHKDILTRSIIHQVKSYETMMMMHEVACCDVRNRRFPRESINCDSVVCPAEYDEILHISEQGGA